RQSIASPDYALVTAIEGRAPLFGDHDLVAFWIADANLTGCALHGKDLHPTVDEALSNSRQAVYLDAKVLDAAAAKRLFFGEHQPHGSVAQQHRAVRLSPYHFYIELGSIELAGLVRIGNLHHGT